MALSVPSPQAPWRLISPSSLPVAGAAAWSRSSLPDAVALLLAPWCPRHDRWYDPVRCTVCRNLPVHLGLREAEDRVRRVLTLEPVWVRKVLRGVAGGLGAWLTGAWSWFTAKGTGLGARSAARVLRATSAPTGRVHTRTVAATGGEWCAAWGVTEDPTGPSSVDAWERVVVRARLTNQVLRTYFDEGVPDSVHLHVARLAREGAQRFHPHGEALYPYLATSLGEVLDCLLVLQMGGANLDVVRGTLNAAGTGFVRYGNCWILPCHDGSVRFITPDAVRAWHHYEDQARTRTAHLGTLLPGWGVQPKSRAEEEAILGRIDRSAQLRLDEAIDFRNLPEGPEEENHYVEALAYCAQWQRKSS